MKNEKAKALVRLIVMVILTTNMALTLAGKNPLPLDENLLAEWLSVGLAGLSVVWGWWKDNNVTSLAYKKKKLADKVAAGETVVMDVEPAEDPEDAGGLGTEYEEEK